MTETIKLSEAIRAGIGDTDQAFQVFWAKQDNGRESLCALGAMMRGLGYNSPQDACSFDRDWDHVLGQDIKCPICTAPGTIRLVIEHMNDEHKKTRLEIADWLQAIRL